MKKIAFLLFGWLTVPHVICYLFAKNKKMIDKDVVRWVQCSKQSNPLWGGKKIALNLMWLLLFMKEYRNVFYLRMGKKKLFLSYLPPLSTLYIWTRSENFGSGTYIQHGFSTVIAAEKVGENCWINQQVTIGWNGSRKYGYGCPIIGNNVRVSAGAKVCGKITVGDNSTVGLNAVVIKDVSSNSVVIPSPMMLIQENGDKVYKKL